MADYLSPYFYRIYIIFSKETTILRVIEIFHTLIMERYLSGWATQVPRSSLCITFIRITSMTNYSIVVKDANLPSIIDKVVYNPVKQNWLRVPLMLISNRDEINRTRTAVYHHPDFGDTVVRLVPSLFHYESSAN